MNMYFNHDYYNLALNKGRNMIKNEFLSMKLLFNVTLFNRRTEVVKFHPINKLLLFVCSHGGDIAIIDNNNIKSKSSIEMIREGKGKGGSICALEFDNNDPTTLYFGSHDTKFTRFNYETKSSDIIMETFDCDHWYTSITHSSNYNNTTNLLVGDNKGKLYFVDPRDSKSIATGMKIHKGKIHDINAHIDGNTFCTASNDKTVQLWDLRAMKAHENEKKKPRSLLSLKHEGVVSSSTWSPYDSNRLLTTTQNDEFRVYDCNLGVDTSPEIIINHPHRFYQHLSIIKPSWHPIVPNLFVCGRYDKDIRGIDMFDVNIIQRQHQQKNTDNAIANTNSPEHYVGNLRTGAVRTINCALAFSTDGSLLASGTANNVAIFSTSKTTCNSSIGSMSISSNGGSIRSQNMNSQASANEGQRIVAELQQQQRLDSRKRKGDDDTECGMKDKMKSKTKTTTLSTSSSSSSKTKDGKKSKMK